MQRGRTRRAFVTAVGLTTLAGCLGGAGGTFSSRIAARKRTRTGGSPDDLPTADRSLPMEYSFSTLDRKMISGGVPKGGIPSIDEPSFLTADGADAILAPDDVVFGVEIDGDVRAYPQHVLVHHEVVNDTVGGIPVSVTYCPLTGTAMGFKRGETTFGVSGKLINNNLVMFDRATDSRWPQMLGTAIKGHFQGHTLEEFRVIWTTWGRWKERHPDTRALSEDTGFARNYNRDPYGSYTPKQGYYTGDRTLFQPLTVDDRYRLKDVVIGARTPEGSIAFIKESLRQNGLRRGSLDGTPYLAVYDRTLDTGYVYRNPDDESFEYVDGRIEATDGTTYGPAELPLDRVYAFDAMWFAWVGFYPSTVVE